MAVKTDSRSCQIEIVRLRKRAEFLTVRKGAKAVRGTMVIEAKKRSVLRPQIGFGFTVTKKTARRSVDRNRIRRRLREVVHLIARQRSHSGFDYVIIGRRAALKAPFVVLQRDFIACLNALDPALLSPNSCHREQIQ